MTTQADAVVDVVGVVGGEVFGPSARAAIERADVLVGSGRHLVHFASAPAPDRVELTGALGPLIDRIAGLRAEGRAVCVLASGDPGFFGIGRVLAARLGTGGVAIHPAPSSVSLAFAAAGMTWDDATVVSAHGRDLAPAAAIAAEASAGGAKVAVLTSPANPPETVGAALLAAGCGRHRVVVAARLGEPDERIEHTDLPGLAGGCFDPMSVVIVVPDPPAAVEIASTGPGISWGRDEGELAHRHGMITKSEVRAIVLAKLALPRDGVLWDIGAGSGSVGVEAATIAGGLRVWAVERNADDALNITANAAAAAVHVEVIVGDAPTVLAQLPDPDRAFVGGGGIDVVRACWDRLAPGARLVATFVVLEHAMAVRQLLGDMIQVHIDRCVPIGTSGVRLEPLNPVFVCWGRR